MTNANQARRRVVAVVGIAVAAAAIVALGIDVPLIRLGGPHSGMGPGHRIAADVVFEPVVRAKVFLTTFTMLALLALGWSYVTLYRDLPNRFTGSLLLVTGALFFYALSSNPVVSLLFGYRGGVGLGPFTFLPDLFAAIAVVVLLYQSYQ